MFRTLILGAMIFAPVATCAQTATTFLPGQPAPSAVVNRMFGSKVDGVNGILTHPSMTNPNSNAITIGPLTPLNTTGNGTSIPSNIPTGTNTIPCATVTQNTNSSACITGRTSATAASSAFTGAGDFLLNATMYSDGNHNGDPVAGFFGMFAAAGAKQSWAMNSVTQFAPGSGGGFAYEADLNNFDCDAGGSYYPAGSACQKVMEAILITGVPGFTMSNALAVSAVPSGTTYGWHNLIATAGGYVIEDALIQENDSADRGWQMAGPHRFGIDFSKATFNSNRTDHAGITPAYPAAAILLPSNGGNTNAGYLAWTGGGQITGDSGGDVVLLPATTAQAVQTGVLNVGYGSLAGITAFGPNGPTIGFNHDGTGETDIIAGPGTGTGGLKIFTGTFGGAISTLLAFFMPNGVLAVGGGVTSPSYTVGSTAGANCAAGTVSLSTFTVVGGIVTHC